MTQRINCERHASSIASWVSLGIGVASGVIALLHPAAGYVAENSPSWFVLAGIIVAVVFRVLARTTGQRYTGLLLATVLLLPAACTLLVLHLLRLVGAIPFPVDPISMCVSIGAAIALFCLWFIPNSLAPRREASVPVPMWVPMIGITASLVYPVLKILWALGVDVAAPPDTLGVVDTTFFATVVVSLAATPALAIALRWWNRPAPGWVRPFALIGGFLLVALGASGLWAVTQNPVGAATGVLVYGGWLTWGAAVFAVAGRLSPEQGTHAPESSATSKRRVYS